MPETFARRFAPAAHAAVAALRDGGQRCLRGELDAMVTAPVNKESIIRAGHKFVGQTEFLSELAGAKRTAMMLLGTDERGRWLRVALATVHIAIKAVPEKLTAEKITLAIELAAQACRDLDLARAKMAVCGLEPACRRRRRIWRRGNQNDRPHGAGDAETRVRRGGSLERRHGVLLRACAGILTPWWPCITTRAWRR